MYAYTSPPKSGSTSISSSSAFQSTTSVAPPCGYQDSNRSPYGCWADYLGFVPAGYVPAPHFANGAVYPCPRNMTASQCRQFEQSCGNGVCDPNESCSDCPIDCGVTGQQTCVLYTGRAGIPSSICQAINQGGPIGGLG